MIEIPLSDHKPHRITVDANEGTVYLSADFPVSELFSSWPVAAAPPEVDGILGIFHPDRAVTSGTSEATAMVLADEVRRLRGILENLRTEIDFRLDPEEARDVAAALAHVAGEVEGGRR